MYLTPSPLDLPHHLETSRHDKYPQGSRAHTYRAPRGSIFEIASVVLGRYLVDSEGGAAFGLHPQDSFSKDTATEDFSLYR